MNNIFSELSAPGVWEVLIGTVIVGLADGIVRGILRLRRKIRERFGLLIDINGGGCDLDLDEADGDLGVFGGRELFFDPEEGDFLDEDDDDDTPPSTGGVGDETAFAEMMRG